MKRTFASGAQKRKQADERKAREAITLSKIPKINELFQKIPTTSSAASTSNVIIDSECEISLPATNVESENTESQSVGVNSDTADVSAGEEDECSELTQFPTDAALWNIDTDIISLQKFWIEKGT